MNAIVHSQLSVKKRKGKIEDYYEIHDFSDCSKEVESSNRHRLYFHTMWGVKNVIIPIFGHTIHNCDGIDINVKDLCENDHILPDYAGRFIPTLEDFMSCVSDIPNCKELTEKFYSENDEIFKQDERIRGLMLSPLWNTGRIESLLVTHNSWFVGNILPRIFINVKIPITKFSINPSLLFNNMSFEDWMQNGQGNPPSLLKINEYRDKNKKKANGKQTSVDTLNETVDGFTKPKAADILNEFIGKIGKYEKPKISPIITMSDIKNVTYDGRR